MVLYGRIRLLRNRVLRKIFDLKRDEMRGGCKKLHSDELHNLESVSEHN
jgi:hypothetical protein